MQTFHVSLTSINDVKHFVNAACSQMCEIDLISGRYIIDAKSIMGIFSIDLAKPIKVEVHGSEDDLNAFKTAVKDYIVD